MYRSIIRRDDQWRWLSFGLLRRVVWQKLTDFSEGDRPDDGGSKHLWNVSNLLPNYTAQQPRKQPFHTRRLENLKSRGMISFWNWMMTRISRTNSSPNVVMNLILFVSVHRYVVNRSQLICDARNDLTHCVWLRVLGIRLIVPTVREYSCELLHNKMLLHVSVWRLTPQAYEIIRDHEYVFGRNISAADPMSNIRQMLEQSVSTMEQCMQCVSLKVGAVFISQTKFRVVKCVAFWVII
jgi:hypothetical protein